MLNTNLVEFDDVRVSEQLEVLYLAPDLANYVQRLDLLPIQDLHSYLMFSQLVLTDLHFTEGSHPKGCPQSIVPNLYDRLGSPTGYWCLFSHLFRVKFRTCNVPMLQAPQR